ncbi:hypothetical protein IJ182_10715 [bacterium]|nr:hypothetical protein [bacterium]
MKISSITTNTGYLKDKSHWSASERARECAKKKYDLKQNNNDNIITTIKRNPDGRASFKGASAAPLLHKIAIFSSEKPLLADALFALSITCCARPLTIMATAKTEEDKEKCHYQVAKSIATGVLGLAMTALISPSISKATKAIDASGTFTKIPEAIKENAQKIIDNPETEKQKETAAKVVKNYATTAKNVMDKVFQPIFMPLRAKLTIMAVPVILGALGLSKGGKKKAQTTDSDKNRILNYNIFQSDNEKVLFGSFSGVANHEN